MDHIFPTGFLFTSLQTIFRVTYFAKHARLYLYSETNHAFVLYPVFKIVIIIKITLVKYIITIIIIHPLITQIALTYHYEFKN